MPRLISGSTIRRGGSGDFIDLKGAMPQLPPTDTTATGFTLVTDSLLRTTYRSSLGFVEFKDASIYSSLPEGTITIVATGTSLLSLSTDTGTLVVGGGIGVGANMFVRDDITVNSLLIGQGYYNPDEGAYNNIVIRGTATNTINDFSNGQNSVAIGHDTLTNLNTSYKSIAIGRYALSTGTNLRNNIAIGDSALKENGVVYERFVLPVVDVTVTARKTITNITNALPAVASVTGHGLNTGSRITIINVNGLTTGTFSWVNNQSFYVDPLTSDTIALYNNNTFSSATALDTRLGTSTAYISSGSLVYPLEITVPNSDYSTGTAIQLTNLITGLEEIENYTLYTNPLGSDVFQLYYNTTVANGVDGTDLTPYVTGGTSTRVLLSSNNIAIGTNAGKSLFDGERNFFLGDYIAQNLTTGSYNFFIGHEVGNNLTRGSGNVSIMGDNLVDGRDNQVNIGGIFYYNGAGYLQLQADTGVGLGTTATNTGSGALAVYGGISVSENIITYGPIDIKSTIESTATTNGALIVAGGVGVSGDVNIGGQLRVEGPEQVNLNPNGANVIIQPQNGGDVSIFPQAPGEGSIDNTVIGASVAKDGYFTNLQVKSTTNTVGTDSGALTVVGGVGIGQDLYVGGIIYGIVSGSGTANTATNIAGGNTGSIVIQTATNKTGFVAIGATGTVLISDGTTPYWGASASSTTSTNSDHIFVAAVQPNTQYYLGLTDTITNYSTVTSDIVLVYDTTDGTLTVPQVSITSNTASTSTNSNQALLVAGGVAVLGSIRGPEGQIEENYLLYTPRVTISTSSPATPRIGDFWIDPNYGVELQWIKDGTSTFWVQFTGL
jgi:hypothetical protein